MLAKSPTGQVPCEPSLVCLGSGSSGNSHLVQYNGTSILVDAGFSAAETRRRLRSVGVLPEDLDAILVTHEHIDHVRGIAVLVKKSAIPVYMTAATYRSYLRHGKPLAERVEFAPGRQFTIGAIEVLPFQVPHDAADPVGFRLGAGAGSISLATDLGHAPEPVQEFLRDGEILVIESNHDVGMLKDGPYPWPLKQRILSRSGHLSNEALCGIIGGVATGKCRRIVLAHLSRTNNRPEVAKVSCEIALDRLGLGAVEVMIADQNRPIPIWGKHVVDV